MTEQGYPPRQPDHPGRSGRFKAPQEPRRPGWQVVDAFDDRPGPDYDAPPWAVPGGIEPRRPARRPRREPLAGPPGSGGQHPPPGWPDEDSGYPAPDYGDTGPQQRPEDPGAGSWPPPRGRRGRSRAAAARRRRSKRRLVTWGGVAITLVILAGVVIWLNRSPAPKSRYVTTLQKGEFRAVPDACKILGTAGLRQLLGGTPKRIQPSAGQTQSQCTYTVDAKPVFRLLNITLQAYRASLAVPVGNGSATSDARYYFAVQRQLLAKPPTKATPVSGVGSQAFSTLQVFHQKLRSDLVTVVVRYRNVLITASVQALANSGFGPADVAGLRSGALSVARSALSRVKAEPTA